VLLTMHGVLQVRALSRPGLSFELPPCFAFLVFSCYMALVDVLFSGQ